MLANGSECPRLRGHGWCVADPLCGWRQGVCVCVCVRVGVGLSLFLQSLQDSVMEVLP